MSEHEQQDASEGIVGQSASTGGLGVSEDICGICGQPGADKMALWTGGGLYWPGERKSETEYVHAECEENETRRAHASLTQQQRDAVLRSVSGGVWP